ncbi:MAG: DNA-methyltransferase [Planctomycetia bacterium]
MSAALPPAGRAASRSVHSAGRRRTATAEAETFKQGDARELGKDLPRDSLALIVTDPPYGIDGDTLHKHYYRDESKVLEGYAEVRADEYAEFTDAWLAHAHRALRPGGSLFVVSGYTRLGDVLAAADKAGLEARHHIIWKYSFGVFTRRKFVSSHYHILHFLKTGAHPTYAFDTGLTDVWAIHREYQPGKVKNKNQLPTALLRRLIEGASQPGERVFDFFLGSFSTARVAKALGRVAGGFELNPTAFEHGMKRGDEPRMPVVPKEPRPAAEDGRDDAPMRAEDFHPLGSLDGIQVDLLLLDDRGAPGARTPVAHSTAIAERLRAALGLLRPGGALFLLTAWPRLQRVLGAVACEREHLEPVNHLIWQYALPGVAGPPVPGDRLQGAHLHLLYLVRRGGARTFEPYARYGTQARDPATGGSRQYRDLEDVWQLPFAKACTPGAWPVSLWQKVLQYCSGEASTIVLDGPLPSGPRGTPHGWRLSAGARKRVLEGAPRGMDDRPKHAGRPFAAGERETILEFVRQAWRDGARKELAVQRAAERFQRGLWSIRRLLKQDGGFPPR